MGVASKGSVSGTEGGREGGVGEIKKSGRRKEE